MPCLLLIGAALCLPGARAVAAIAWSLGIEDIQGDGWHAQGITVSLAEQSVDRIAVAIHVDQFDLPDGYGTLRGLKLECPAAQRDESGWVCAEGRLAMQDSPLQGQDAPWHASYDVQGGIRIVVPRLALGEGGIGLELTASNGTWTAQLRPDRAAVADLAGVSPSVALPRDWGIKGRVSGQVALEGMLSEIASARADLTLERLDYASPDGTQAAEKVRISTKLNARVERGQWYFDAQLAWPDGALYSEPLYVDAAKGPLEATAVGNWDAARQRLVIDSWAVRLADTVAVFGTGRFVGPDLALEDLTVAVQSDHAGRLYQRVLQPFMIGSAADDMSVTGRVGMALHFDDKGVEQAGLELNALAFEDHQGRFSLDQADGSVAWDRSKEVPVSRVAVKGASLYRIPTGPFGVHARFAGERIYLVEPVVVPLLAGEVGLDSFELTGALMSGGQLRWEASASVRGVSLEQLTETLAWPPFGGTVAGQLRNMRYVDQQFTIGGGLQLAAFGGEIQVNGLSIQDPFGSVPILNAAATLRGLNLEALTQTFSFGRIEGRINGDVDNIQLVGWQPDRFDLHLYTPDEDDSRHRISQRAVQNLTELGSGVPAGLSTAVLTVFNDFRYDRIDIKIELQGNTAELDGLARPDGGYYLVKGAGLPRIDVIGRNRSVAWKDLLKRLQQIQVEGAQIR